MDIVERARTTYSDTEEIAGWCDVSTYEGAETAIHLLGMYETLQEMAKEIERLREALRFYANHDNYRLNWNEYEKVEFTTVEIDNGRQARAALKGDE